MSEGRRVLVTGGRDYSDSAKVITVLSEYHELHGIAMLAHGACEKHGNLRGADGAAEAWAIVNSVPYVGWPADWTRFGRSAGPRRNAELLAWFRPDVCIAFPGGTGTADCVRRCRAAGCEVVEVER